MRAHHQFYAILRENFLSSQPPAKCANTSVQQICCSSCAAQSMESPTPCVQSLRLRGISVLDRDAVEKRWQHLRG
jgi:hypothetical protein